MPLRLAAHCEISKLSCCETQRKCIDCWSRVTTATLAYRKAINSKFINFNIKYVREIKYWRDGWVNVIIFAHIIFAINQFPF